MNKITNQSCIQTETGQESGIKKCYIHTEQEYAGICLNKECKNERILVCYECIYQMHSEHSKDVLIFKHLEQKQQDQLLTIFKNNEVLSVYQKIEEYREKYSNDILIEDKRMSDIKNKYKQQFQQTINKLHQMVNQQIDDIYDQHNNKCLYLLDQMFQKHYPLEQILYDFKQLKNTNKVNKQIIDLEQKVKNILANQQASNHQIINMNKVDEGQKIENYLDRLLESVEANIYQQSELLFKTMKFIDCSEKHGFKPLMKLVKDDMHYNNQLWTTKVANMTFSSCDFKRENFEQSSVIYEEYYYLNIKQILIETFDEDNSVRYSLLQKTQYRPFVNEFKENKVQSLRVMDGEINPLVLFGGEQMRGVKVLGQHWRINSQQCNTKDNFKVRLGCYFLYSNSQFDRDSAGNSCSHEVAGLGITDDYYKNSGNRFRSAGVRQFNNRNTLPSQMGQHYARVNIYGR